MMLRRAFLICPRQPTLNLAGRGLGYTRRYVTDSPNAVSSASRLATIAGFMGLAGTTAYYFLRPDTPVGAPTSSSLPLAPSHFTPTTLISTETTSPTTKVLTIQLPTAAIPSSPPNAMWSIYVKDTDIMVERPFTPLYGVDDQGRLQLWVRRYDDGEMGRWLHTRRPGETIEVRGPMETLRWPFPASKPDKWDEIVMISGGTGFAPFFQLIHHQLLAGSSELGKPQPKFTLLHSSRSPSELPPSSLLTPLKQYAAECPDRLSLRLFVDELGNASADPTDGIKVRRIDKLALSDALGRSPESWWSSWLTQSPLKPPKRTLFLVCGPEPMINAIAGPYGRNFSQGAVGGVLKELGCESEQVRKL